MELMKAQSATLLAKVKDLYMEAFPLEERKPFDLMENMQESGTVEILAAQDGEKFLGLAITVAYKNLVLLDYFAISENFRSGGVGTNALTLLKERYKGKKFFLEIEDPEEKTDNQEQRIRRKHFYLRNGMTRMPFLVKVAGINMEVLTHDCTLNYEEYKSVYAFGYGPEIERIISLIH